jgi:hypothetical protein
LLAEKVKDCVARLARRNAFDILIAAQPLGSAK